MTEQDLKNMKLHEEMRITEWRTVLKVINGWLYKTVSLNCGQYNMTETFVQDIVIVSELVWPR